MAKEAKAQAKTNKYKVTNPEHVIIIQLPRGEDGQPRPVLIGKEPVACEKTEQLATHLKQGTIEQV